MNKKDLTEQEIRTRYITPAIQSAAWQPAQIREEVYRAINAPIGIVDFAETHNYDLIVISTCVQSKLERFFLGSTTEKVISYTHIPIFAIPPTYCLA